MVSKIRTLLVAGPRTTILNALSARLALGALLLACASIPAHAGLISHWVADDWAGGTVNWVDRVGGKVAAVATSSTSATKTLGALPGGISASALVFDGIDDGFVVASSQNPIVGQNSVTIAAFFNATSGASGSDVAFYQFPGPLNAEAPGVPNDWGLTYDAAGNARGFFNANVTPPTPISLIDGMVHTMMMTWQDPSVVPGGVARFYVDGVFVGSPSNNIDGGSGIVNSSFLIGRSQTRLFSGAIGELRFYDSVEDTAALHAAMSNTVPEPGTSALLCLGLAGLGFSRRKARSKQST